MFRICLILIAKSPGIQIILQKIILSLPQSISTISVRKTECVIYKTIQYISWLFYFHKRFLSILVGKINNSNWSHRDGDCYRGNESIIYTCYNQMLKYYESLYIIIISRKEKLRMCHLNYFNVPVIINQSSVQNFVSSI